VFPDQKEHNITIGFSFGGRHFLTTITTTITTLLFGDDNIKG
jgi:hypothetical protein